MRFKYKSIPVSARWHSIEVGRFTKLKNENTGNIKVRYAELNELKCWNERDPIIDEVLGVWKSPTTIILDKVNIEKAAIFLQRKAPELGNIEDIQQKLEDMVLIHEWAHAYDDLGQTKHSRLGNDTCRNEFAACYITTRVINGLSCKRPELQLVLDAWDKYIKVPPPYLNHNEYIKLGNDYAKDISEREQVDTALIKIDHGLDIIFLKWLHSDASATIWNYIYSKPDVEEFVRKQLYRNINTGPENGEIPEM